MLDGYVSDCIHAELGERLGSYASLERILQERDIEELVIALDTYHEGLMKDIIFAANKEGVRVNIIPTYNDFIPPNPAIDVIGDTSIEERVRYDLWYINRWLLRLNIEILLKTAFGSFMNQEKVGIRK